MQLVDQTRSVLPIVSCLICPLCLQVHLFRSFLLVVLSSCAVQLCAVQLNRHKLLGNMGPGFPGTWPSCPGSFGKLTPHFVSPCFQAAEHLCQLLYLWQPLCARLLGLLLSVRTGKVLERGKGFACSRLT